MEILVGVSVSTIGIGRIGDEQYYRRFQGNWYVKMGIMGVKMLITVIRDGWGILHGDFNVRFKEIRINANHSMVTYLRFDSSI